MKLLIQIPCFNEEATLPVTVRAIPRRVEGFDRVEIVVIDDGSTDRTCEVAREIGVDHVVRHRENRGLAAAFQTGIDTCLRLGADVIVNTDADNQYDGADIPALARPILRGEADIVVGDRRTDELDHFSLTKRLLQRLGSSVVRRFSGTAIPDTVSGFRAISREVALDLNILSPFSYTIEMLIQAGRKRMRVTSVPVRVNPQLRESRLFRSVPGFIGRSVASMLRIYSMYQPLRVFVLIGSMLGLLGLLPIVRFLYFYSTEGGVGHVQSLVLGAMLLVMGFGAILVGLVADLINFNRRLLEMTLEKVRRIEAELDHDRDPRGVAPPSAGGGGAAEDGTSPSGARSVGDLV